MVIGPRGLSIEDDARIRLALATAQNSTHATFELAVVQASDHYALFPVAWGALGTVAVTGTLALVRPELRIGAAFVFELGLLVVATLALDWWPIRLAIVPSAAKRNAASRMAHHEFAVRIVGNSHERNGVMLFVSLGERYVEILADQAVHARVPQESWERIVSEFTDAMKANRYADGLVAAIQAIGEILAAALPH